MSHFQIFKDEKGEYRWRFRADNNEIIADSAEGYKAKADCEHGIEVLRREIADARIEDHSERP